ncbi:MAG: hypothetical protein NTV52_10450 [Acidobacteria bacterium]|nr:hypothetical protein [Acidobacteriota bacterium]
MTHPLFQQIAALDEQLLAIPYGEELAVPPLFAQRNALVQSLLAEPTSPAWAEPLQALGQATQKLHDHFAHARRRIASDAGETDSHRRFLDTLHDSLDPAPSSPPFLA